MMLIMVFGTFDNLHPGHQDYFRQAWRGGVSGAKKVKAPAAASGRVEMIAVVARDKNVLKIKGRAAQEDEKTRAKKVRAAWRELGIKGRVILGAVRDRWAVLKKYRPDIICLGYDQKTDWRRLKVEITKSCPDCKIKKMKAHHPEKYKSSYCRVKE